MIYRTLIIALLLTGCAKTDDSTIWFWSHKADFTVEVWIGGKEEGSAYNALSKKKRCHRDYGTQIDMPPGNHEVIIKKFSTDGFSQYMGGEIVTLTWREKTCVTYEVR